MSTYLGSFKLPFLHLLAILALAFGGPSASQAAPPKPAPLKTAVAQLSPVVGDFEGNFKLIAEAYEKAVAAGADILVTPELSVIGYPPLDLLDRPDVAERCEAIVKRLQKLTAGKKTALVVGSVTKNPRKTGRAIQNSLIVLDDGKVIHRQAKMLLPTYDIFDEARYFEPGDPLNVAAAREGAVPKLTFEKNGYRVGLLNCEDGWAKDLQRGRQIYHVDPADLLRQQKPDVLVWPSASPSNHGKAVLREEVYGKVGRKLRVPVIGANQVGSTDDIAFDGQSPVIDREGKVVGRMDSYQEGFGVVEYQKGRREPLRALTPEAFRRAPVAEVEQTRQAIIQGIRDYARKTGVKGVVIGMSGGADSALVTELAVEALGKDRVLGVAMPSKFSSSHSLEDAREQARRAGIRFEEHPISGSFDATMKELGDVGNIGTQNAQSRDRMKFLWSLANRDGYTVMGTSNKSEMAMGYLTIGGDSTYGLNPIGDLYKTEVYELMEHINASAGKGLEPIPHRTITKAPSAELAFGQVDTDSLPEYKILDPILRDYIENGKTVDELTAKYTRLQPDRPANWVAQLIDQFEKNEWKRKQVGPILRLSKKGFGIGRRIPITAVWDKIRGVLPYARPKLAAAPAAAAAEVARAPKADLELLQEIDRQFRSSQRYIPAEDLWKEAVTRIDRKLMVELAKRDQAQLLRALQGATAGSPELLMNRGVAENLLKIHRMAQLCGDHCAISSHFGDRVSGLEQPALDKLVASLPDTTAALTKSGEFDYKAAELAKILPKSILDNDLYNFKIAALYFDQGFHNNRTSTFSMFSRGKSNRPFMVAAGQDVVLDVLNNLHITEREIQYLKNHPDFKHVSPEFFDYLRNFKFRGTVRGMKPGTVFFAGQPILEISGNPVETQIVETLITPIMNAMSNTATKTARVVANGNGRVIIEGGTRRSAAGVLSALGAMAGGADGTSNTHAARLADVPAKGTMNHASVLMFEDEAEAFTRYMKLFPETVLLGDTHSILGGVRAAVAAGGDKLLGIRLDSQLPGMTVEETTQTVRKLLDDLGYPKVQIVYSNRLDEFQLAAMKDAPFRFALVGTELASPSDTNGLNLVYKNVQYTKGDGTTVMVGKKSSGKANIPGAKQIWRERRNGKLMGDIMGVAGEAPPVAGAEPLLETLMENGQRVLPRTNYAEVGQTTKAALRQIPADMLKVDAEAGSYPIRYTPELQKLADSVQGGETTAVARRVGVYFGSFDPATEAHDKLARWAKQMGPFDEVILVPTGDNPVHGKRHKFTAQQRLKILQRRFKDVDGIRIYDGEVKGGKGAYTVDTLDAIKRTLPKDTRYTLIGGEDLFATVGSWKGAERLLTENDWLIMDRDGTGKLAIPEALRSRFEKIGDRYFRGIGKNRIQLVNAHLPPVSSTQVREAIEEVDTIFHSVDTQSTFWEGVHGRKPGPLAVPGSGAISQNVADLKRLAYASPKIKSIQTVDYHFKVETRRPEVNAEFHPSPDGTFPGFPDHGMAGKTGPAGPEVIPEARVFAAKQQLVIPHHRPRGNKLELVPFDVDAQMDRVLDPNVELVLQKNGPGSYDIFQNPRAEQVYKAIKPKRIVVYGVATDFCVDAAVKGMMRKFPETEILVVSDAISGVFCDTSKQKIEEMKKGARFVTTDELFDLYPEYRTVRGIATAGKTPAQLRQCIGSRLLKAAQAP